MAAIVPARALCQPALTPMASAVLRLSPFMASALTPCCRRSARVEHVLLLVYGAGDRPVRSLERRISVSHQLLSPAEPGLPNKLSRSLKSARTSAHRPESRPRLTKAARAPRKSCRAPGTAC